MNETDLQTAARADASANRYLQHDGSDAAAAMRAGLEITGICIACIAVILTLYYTGLRLLVAFFPPKHHAGPGAAHPH